MGDNKVAEDIVIAGESDSKPVDDTVITHTNKPTEWAESMARSVKAAQAWVHQVSILHGIVSVA